MKADNTNKLQGIIPPIATPLLDQYTMDKMGLVKLLKHVIDGGVHGLFMLGTTGEAVSLSYRLRYDIMEQCISEVRGQLPVLVGVSDTSLEEAIAFSRKAEKAGVSGIVVAPPYYFPCAQEALYEYVVQLAEAINIPTYIYNIPSHSPHVFSEDTVVRLLNHPQIAGYKDSSCSMMAFHQMKHKLGAGFNKTYLLGPEELLGEAVMMGADGGVNGGANAFPQLYVSLYHAAKAGDVQKVNALQEQVMRISHTLYQGGKTVIQGIKFALTEMGICQDFVALPLAPLDHLEKEAMRQFLEKFEVVL
ncbi:dihydrodipicolinate synthase/N-acetylneuraminate lyase [Catalinimonas alkaloidigena]|uniref:dihydrodipicolinate synthase family protein n=1 Tax=Catalinimonas alkaloidigena TaxID=1075417 RepID=UPI0024061D84|nr:dihydrodipicolinate synthase family protein [Catalinimonas alkaloidigena]MDF9796636.1 dihydrodipicolinate synthase/N-acetylneuraminate lyase [Catalinimonas alkaloidigena]